jgi:membrane protein
MQIRIVNVHNVRNKLKSRVLPGFEGIPINLALKSVIKGFTKGTLVTRASSIAFNLLMALIPASIFLFTLIPFISITNFQQELIRMFENILPSNVYNFLETTIIQIVTVKSGGLLLIMFVATVLFSTNGIHAIINAFVVSAHEFRSRSWIDQRKISIILLMIVVFLFSSAAFFILYCKMAVNRLGEMHIIQKELVIYTLIAIKWLIIILLLFMAISFLYYLAPAKRTGFRFFSPGSTLATLLFILTSLGFSAYVNKYGQYNKLYGSVGTLMVTLIWLYLNSIALLIGFELNVSIKAAQANILKQDHDPSYDEFIMI